MIRHRHDMGMRLLSVDDIDVESCRPSHHTKLFDLKATIFRLWKKWKEITETLYYEDTQTVLKERPVFDTEKTTLIKLDSIIESHIRTGTFRKFTFDDSLIKKYDAICINAETSQKEWNDLAKKANSIIFDLIEILTKERDLKDSMFMMGSQSYSKKQNKTQQHTGKIFYCVMVALCIAVTWTSATMVLTKVGNSTANSFTALGNATR